MRFLKSKLKRYEVIAIFPSIINIDGEEVTPKISIGTTYARNEMKAISQILKRPKKFINTMDSFIAYKAVEVRG